MAGAEAGKAALGGRDGDEGVGGPQGLYVIHLACVSAPPEEMKAAGIEQVLEGTHAGSEEPPLLHLAHVQVCWHCGWMGFGGQCIHICCEQEVWALHTGVCPRRRIAGSLSAGRCFTLYARQSWLRLASVPRCCSPSWLAALPWAVPLSLPRHVPPQPCPSPTAGLFPSSSSSGAALNPAAHN